jgi:hypothetical protein
MSVTKQARAHHFNLKQYCEQGELGLLEKRTTE